MPTTSPSGSERLGHCGFAETDQIKHDMQLGFDLLAHHEKLDADLHCLQDAHDLSDPRQKRTRLVRLQVMLSPFKELLPNDWRGQRRIRGAFDRSAAARTQKRRAILSRHPSNDPVRRQASYW